MVRGWHIAVLLGLFLGFVCATAVQAEAVGPADGEAATSKVSEGGTHEAGGHAAHAADDGGLFGQALDLGIWTIVVFLVLLFVLSKFAWKPLLQGLQQREHSIHEAAEQAELARKESEQLRGQLRAEMDKAAERVREIMDVARRDAQKTTEEMIGKARAEIQSERERLRREIDTARDQALQDLWNRSAQLAAQISAKVLRRQMTADDQRRLVDDALGELAQASRS